MKILKKVSCFVLTLAMLATIVSVPDAAYAATTKDTVPAKIRIYSGVYDNSAISFDYDNAGDQVKNVKTNSKNLIARQTRQESASEEYAKDSDLSYNSAQIGLYAKKEGKYTVSFDVYSSDGTTKRNSYKVTVFAKNDSPFTDIKYAGQSLFSYNSSYSSSQEIVTKSSGKLSIKMAKGYKLKKIEVITRDKAGNEVVKVVKNNKKIKLGEYPYSYSYEYQSSYNPQYWRSYWYKYMNASTRIQITYKDKWTKQEEVTSYSINKLAK